MYMADPFMGEIKLGAWSYAPRGWAFCNGALMAISSNQALFSLLGTLYGGDGVRTFGLPDLRGRVPMHLGKNPAGTIGGEEMHALTVAEMPVHTHQFNATAVTGTSPSVLQTPWLGGSPNEFGTFDPAAQTTLLPGSIAPAGSGAGHENRQPYLCLNYVIALTGIYPSRN
jgi:microcystin-dependent protein